jgi:heme-degrading monooxygenase HmoA
MRERGKGLSMAFIMTRIQVGDYEAFKPMFDKDSPGVRKTANGYRLFRGVEDPNEVFIQVEFASAEEAKAGRERLLAAGVLERWSDRTGPTVVEEAEAVVY